MDSDMGENPALIGEECHIVGRGKSSARSDDPLPKEQRDYYGNLILLCRNHHKVIDDQEEDYPKEKLLKLKKDHEEWVRTQLKEFDPKAQLDFEIYAAWLEQWESKAGVATWDEWTSGLFFAGQPRIRKSRLEELRELNDWLIRRPWPGRIPELERAFINFQNVLNQLILYVDQSCQEVGDLEPELRVEKTYKTLRSYDADRYDFLKRKYDYLVDLIEDLGLELTRAANLIALRVRQTLLQDYRLEEGLLVVQSGPHMDLTVKTYRPRYSAGEREEGFPGLKKFLEIRQNRDVWFGKGYEPEFLPLLEIPLS